GLGSRGLAAPQAGGLAGGCGGALGAACCLAEWRHRRHLLAWISRRKSKVFRQYQPLVLHYRTTRHLQHRFGFGEVSPCWHSTISSPKSKATTRQRTSSSSSAPTSLPSGPIANRRA